MYKKDKIIHRTRQDTEPRTSQPQHHEMKNLDMELRKELW